jgi:hypothetical protein
MKKVVILSLATLALVPSVFAESIVPTTTPTSVPWTSTESSTIPPVIVTSSDAYSVVRSQDRKHWAGYGYAENGNYVLYYDGRVIREISSYPVQIFFANNSLYFLTSDYSSGTYGYTYTLWKNNEVYIQAEKIEVSDSSKYGQTRYIISQDKWVLKLQTVKGRVLLEVKDVSSFYSSYNSLLNLMDISVTMKDGSSRQYLGDTLIKWVTSIGDTLGTVERDGVKNILFRGSNYSSEGCWCSSYKFFLYNPDTKKVSYFKEYGDENESYYGQSQVIQNDAGEVTKFWYTVKTGTSTYAVVDGLKETFVYTDLKNEPSLFLYANSIGITYSKSQKYYLFLEGKTYGPYDALGTFQNSDLVGFQYSNTSDWWIIVRKNHKNFLLINGKEFPF